MVVSGESEPARGTAEDEDGEGTLPINSALRSSCTSLERVEPERLIRFWIIGYELERHDVHIPEGTVETAVQGDKSSGRDGFRSVSCSSSSRAELMRREYSRVLVAPDIWTQPHWIGRCRYRYRWYRPR